MFHFQWSVCTDGYEWRPIYTDDAQESEQAIGGVTYHYGDPALFEIREGEGRRVRQYRPLAEYPALYMEFAMMRQMKERYLAFANTYGWLGCAQHHFSPTPTGTWRPEGETEDHPTFSILGKAEPLPLWHNEITNLRSAVDLWLSIQSGNLDSVLDRIKITPTSILYDRGIGDEHWDRHHHLGVVVEIRGRWKYVDGEKHNTADEDERPDRFGIEFTKRKDLAAFAANPARLARQALMREINKHLRATAALAATDSNFEIQFYPETLIQALWVQFALAVSGNKTMKQCDECGTWFEPKRSDALTCSGRCRTRKSLKRKQT